MTTQLALNAIVTPYVVIINQASNKIAFNKWKQAKALVELQEIVNWKKTHYKSFRKFCEKEVTNVGYASVVSYVAAYRKSLAVGLTWSDLRKVSRSLSFSRAVKTLRDIHSPTSVDEIIAYGLGSIKIAPSTNGMYKSKSRNKKGRIHITIQAKYEDNLRRLLAPYGYQGQCDETGVRTGLLPAMRAFLKTQ